MYCMYLRKSRKDMDAEAHGAGETLARHEEALFSLSKKMGLPISKVFREIVSGETISDRPVMQQLLREVGDGLWEGVFVMEVERLARGDTKDQGTVAETFKYSNTLIVTPLKTYDPSDEYDEEYFEFGLFMSRREYKTINRRIQRGRIASVKEGKWIYSDAPYGYTRVKIESGKGYTLKPNPDEAPAVQLMFKLYTEEHIGSTQIANRLNALGYKPRRSSAWRPASIRDILSNVVYAGWIKKGERPEKKYVENGVVKKIRKTNTDYLCVKGLHEPIVSQEVFDRGRFVCKSHTVTSNNGKAFDLKNPFAGIIECGICGHKMQYVINQGKNQHRIICNLCDNISSDYYAVEQSILTELEEYLNKIKVSVDAPDDSVSDAIKSAITLLEKEKTTVQGQINKLYDFLEQGIYDKDLFMARNKTLGDRLSEITSKLADLHESLDKEFGRETAQSFIPKIEHVLDSYPHLTSAYEKNVLLKSVLQKVVYTKTEKGPGKERAYSIEIYPLLLCNNR